MAKSSFQHLPIPSLRQGPARAGRWPSSDDRTKVNRTNFAGHAKTLKGQVTGAIASIQKRLAERSEDAPDLPAGVPLTIQVDPKSFDLDKLRKHFDFELVLEDEDGFVIVATEDISLGKLQTMVDDYSTDTYGSATVASIYSVDDDEGQVERLRRILAPRLFAIWPTISTLQELIVDVSVECLGTVQIDDRPNRGNLNDRAWAAKEADWYVAKSNAYQQWDDLKEKRERQIRRFILGHEGEILQIVDGEAFDAARLPDSFSVRVSISGDGLRDLVLNYGYVFEVIEPEEIQLPQNGEIDDADDGDDTNIVAPPANAPAVCIIDSGIQEAHRLLQPAVDTNTSHSFLPNDPSVMDGVSNGGHGTRVAGVALFGESVPLGETYESNFWLQNARVLDQLNSMPRTLFPPALMEAVVARFHGGIRRTRLFNQSINVRTPCRQRHMSAWAATIDHLSFDKDVLFIQSVGNILIDTGQTTNPGIVEHLRAGRAYPDFLYEASFRVANPAHSFQSLTVGSVSYGSLSDPQWSSFSRRFADASAFSRSGLGIWDVLKPDVVELGGDYFTSVSGDVATPSQFQEGYPQTVRATISGGPAVARDSVGTSYSAPKVTHLAARLQALFPEEPCLLYRALIAQSARWPEWAYETVDAEQKLKYLRNFGYGIPNQARATSNTPHRSTLITQGEERLSAGQAKIFQIPIPQELRNIGDEFDIQIEVTLSYAANPRRTRRGFRGYLSTWLEWKACGLQEKMVDFRNRIFNDEDEKGIAPEQIPWELQKEVNRGVSGFRRTAGTLQKDWAIVKSYQLPETFCVAVIGHRGWSKDPESEAKFALAVSFESVDQEIEIHERLEVAVNDLWVELNSQVEVEAEVDTT
jgi:hypothetical protein